MSVIFSENIFLTRGKRTFFGGKYPSSSAHHAFYLISGTNWELTCPLSVLLILKKSIGSNDDNDALSSCGAHRYILSVRIPLRRGEVEKYLFPSFVCGSEPGVIGFLLSWQNKTNFFCISSPCIHTHTRDIVARKQRGARTLSLYI